MGCSLRGKRERKGRGIFSQTHRHLWLGLRGLGLGSRVSGSSRIEIMLYIHELRVTICQKEPAAKTLTLHAYFGVQSNAICLLHMT